MVRRDTNAPPDVGLDLPRTFFEDAIEALENTETRPRLREIELKAHSMAKLANRICDRALHAEADKIARLAREKMTLLPPEKSEATPRGFERPLGVTDAHRRR